MLAQKYKSTEYPCYSQAKLDGVRCIVQQDSIKTRTGKDHLSVPHIVELCKEIFKETPNVVLDGELYNHDFKDNFNKITSLVRKSKPSQSDLDESANIIQYHIYDCYFKDEPTLNFTERREKLLEERLEKLTTGLIK